MNNLWYDNFIEMLYKKYHKKAKLTETLMELLSLERESVYRRLRKEVIFPVHELIKIASAWNISLDEIIGVNSSQVSFKLHLWNYLDPSERELNDMQRVVQWVEAIKIFPDLEYMEVSNKLPRVLTSGFLYIHRFYLLRWLYQYVNKDVLPFSQIPYPEEIAKFSEDYYEVSKQVATTNFIWDSVIFNYLVQDIQFFHSIYLITNEEKKLIKKDLHALLNYVSEITSKGCWPETGNKVNLYISYINIDTNYNYYYSGEVKLCCVHAFGKNEIYTINPLVVEDFKGWMQSKKRATVQISQADEKSRIEFFMKQREVIDTL